MPHALDGIRILDLTTWQQGPGATVLLADMGAEVIKIEDPLIGDPGRAVTMGPEHSGSARAMHESMNHNKRGMTLNLKLEQGRNIFYRMVKQADVVATNYRVGVAEELGIGYGTLKEYNAKIIAAVSTGMGERGPDAQVRLLDILGQSRAGLMNLLADPDKPLRYVGAWGLSDQTGAIMFSNAILSALLARERHGIGQQVNVSQLSSVMQLQTLAIHMYLFTGVHPRTLGREQTHSPLFNIYQGRDGKWFCMACTPPDRFWKTVVSAVGLGHLAEDPRYDNVGARNQRNYELVKLFDDHFQTKDRDEWVRILVDAGAMATPVQNYEDLLHDQQVSANHYITEMEHPEAGVLKMLAPPITFSHTPTRTLSPAPQFGEHTEEVLLEHDYSWDEIARFRDAGII